LTGEGQADTSELAGTGDGEGGEDTGAGGGGLAGDDASAVPRAAVAAGGDEPGDAAVGATVPGRIGCLGGDDHLVVGQIDLPAGDADAAHLDEMVVGVIVGHLERAAGDGKRRRRRE